MEDTIVQTVHSFPFGLGQQIRFNLKKFRGKLYADLRIWFQLKNETEFHPSKKGISFAIEQMSEFQKGFHQIGQEKESFIKKFISEKAQ